MTTRCIHSKKVRFAPKKEVKCVAKQKLQLTANGTMESKWKKCALCLHRAREFVEHPLFTFTGVFCAIQHVDTKSFPVGSSTVVYGQNTDGNSTVDALWHTNLIDQPTRRHTFYSPFDPMSRAIMDNITSATSYILTRSCKQLISISQSKTVATANACTGIEQVARSEQFGYAVNWVTRVNLVNTFLPSFYYHFFSLFPFSRCSDDQIKFYFLIFPRAPPFLHVLVITQRCCSYTWFFFSSAFWLL